MATSQRPLNGACIFLIFSLTRYFRKLLENAFDLSQRSQKQRELLHCYSWPGFKISIFVCVFFFFFLTAVQRWMKITGVQGCRWNRTDCSSVCIRLYRNRVSIFSKNQFSCLTTISDFMRTMGQNMWNQECYGQSETRSFCTDRCLTSFKFRES